MGMENRKRRGNAGKRLTELLALETQNENESSESDNESMNNENESIVEGDTSMKDSQEESQTQIVQKSCCDFDYEDYVDFKKYINTEIIKIKAVICPTTKNSESEDLRNQIYNLQRENETMKNELIKNEKLIDTLLSKIEDKNDNNGKEDAINEHSVAKSNSVNKKNTNENPRKSKTRPEVCITENYIQQENRIPLRPGNRTFASATKYGKKILVTGDSHIKRVKRNIFNNSITNGKSYLKSFSGANAKHLGHYILAHLRRAKT